ncbi:hypothetical protein HMPREF3038_02227 [Akkermansia sp. KLE1797]|nr:hypothetical protein HMPREF3038_02227 [Akkermansia sp. KLE1797]
MRNSMSWGTPGAVFPGGRARLKIMAAFHASHAGFCLPLIHNPGMCGNPFHDGKKGYSARVLFT